MFIWSIFLMLFIVCCSSNRSTFSCIQNCVGDRQQFADITEIIKLKKASEQKMNAHKYQNLVSFFGFLFIIITDHIHHIKRKFSVIHAHHHTVLTQRKKWKTIFYSQYSLWIYMRWSFFLPTITGYVISQLFGNFFHFPLEQLVFFSWWLLLAVVMVWQAAVACAFM